MRDEYLFEDFILFLDSECLCVSRFVLTEPNDLGFDIFNILLFPLPMVSGTMLAHRFKTENDRVARSGVCNILTAVLVSPAPVGARAPLVQSLTYERREGLRL